jgi:hypothetical protein
MPGNGLGIGHASTRKAKTQTTFALLYRVSRTEGYRTKLWGTFSTCPEEAR